MVLSSKADTKHGANLSGVIVDELHVQPNSELVHVLHTSTSARPQPITLYLTTAGTDTESICYEKYTYAKAVLKREIIDHTFFPVIYEAGEKDDINDPAVWKKVNPNLGISKYPAYIADQLKTAQTNRTYLLTIKRLDFNQWTGKFASWSLRDKWGANSAEYTLDDFKGEMAFVGLDLASNRDLTSVCAIVPKDTGEIGERLNERGRTEKYKIFEYYLFPFYWMPSDSLKPEYTERDQRLLNRLKRYAENGHIRLMDSASIDVDEIVTFISTELGSHFKIEEVIGDKWNALQALNQLAKLRFTTVEWGQGFGKMSTPTKLFETLTLNGRIKHNNNPVLAWNLENTVIEEDNYGNKRPNKKKSQEKIDGIVAAITAFGRVAVWEQKASVYRDRGLILL
jgi:phage terminase large subunit-like protein